MSGAAVDAAARSARVRVCDCVGASYLIGLRNTLDAAGHTNVKIILPDGASNPSSIMADAAANATFNATFYGIGLHYQHNAPAPEVEAGGAWSLARAAHKPHVYLS